MGRSAPIGVGAWKSPEIPVRGIEPCNALMNIVTKRSKEKLAHNPLSKKNGESEGLVKGYKNTEWKGMIWSWNMRKLSFFVIKYGMQNVWIRMQLKVRFKNTCLVIKIRDTNVFQFYSKKYIFIIHFWIFIFVPDFKNRVDTHIQIYLKICIYSAKYIML